ncbi:MAG: hypothetical protein ACFFA3_15855 [Promethearchaeota archaeon]
MIIDPIVGGIVYEISTSTPFIISILVEWALIPFFILGIYILNPQVVESLEEVES